MKKVIFRYLSQEDIIKINLPLESIITMVEGAMESKGREQVECPPKPGIHTRDSTFIHAMPAFIKDKDICGLKWVSGYPENYRYDLPQIAGLIIYNCPDTGMPKAVMDCRWITAMRTAAVSAVTAKYYKPKKAETLGVIGAGVQARTHALMLKAVAPEIKRLLINDVNPASAEKFAAEMTGRIDAEIVISGSAEQLVREADILVTATQRLPQPIVKYQWLKRGVLGLALEASRAWEGKAILNADIYITDDWDLTQSYQKQGAFPDGLPDVYYTLGKVVAGLEPRRENPDDIVLAINEGMAISDVAIAKAVYDLAVEKDIGIELPLMEQESVF